MAPAWRLSTELTISAATEELSRPYTMVVTTTGTIAVVDNATLKVSIYDSTGRRIGRVGGRGNGPGEFRFVNEEIRGVVGDSVWFSDFAARRVNVYTSRGKPGRTTTIGSTSAAIAGSRDTLRSVNPIALLSDGRTIVRGSLARTARELESGGAPSAVAVQDRTGRITWLLGRVEGSTGFVNAATANSRISLTIPFVYRPQIAASSDGAFVVFVTAANGRDLVDTVRVTVVRPSGDTLYSIRQLLPRTRMPEASYLAARESQLRSAAQSGIESQVREALLRQLPRSYPAVDFHSFVTREGRTWLRLHPESCKDPWPSVCDGPTRYLIFSPTGKPDGMVAVPAGLTLTDAFGGRAWGFAEDDDGFRNIVRSRLHR